MIGGLPALTIATCGLRLESTRSRATEAPRNTRNVCQGPAGELLGASPRDHSQGQAHTLVLCVETKLPSQGRSPKSEAVPGTCRQVPLARRICGNFCLTRLFFWPHSLINQPAISSWGGNSHCYEIGSQCQPLASTRYVARHRARGSGIPLSTSKRLSVTRRPEIGYYRNYHEFHDHAWNSV